MRVRLFRLLILFFFICSNCYASISGISGTTADGESVVISGSGFGAHADYDEDGDQTCLSAQWKNFDDGSITSGGWSIVDNATAEWTSTATDRTGDGYYGKREYSSTRLAALYYNQGADIASTKTIYVSFWARLDETNYRGGKIFRWYWGSDSSRDNHYLASGDSNSYLRGASEVPGNPTQYGSSSCAFTYGQWSFVEYIATTDGSGNGTVVAKIDNKQAWSVSNWFTGGIFSPEGHSIDIANLCEQSDGSQHGEIDYDDIYVSYTQSRVIIGNAEKYSDCTHLEIQIPHTWSDTSIGITVNTGSFNNGDGVYLFVIDSDGTASAGYPIQIGEEQAGGGGGTSITGTISGNGGYLQ